SHKLSAAPHGLQAGGCPELREFSVGRWEGVTAEEIRTLDPSAFTAWMADVGRFQFPEGESLADVEARAWPAFESIVERHAGGSVLVVAHGGPNRILLCRALGIASERILSLGRDSAALSVLEPDRGRWRLSLLNHREPVRE